MLLGLPEKSSGGKRMTCRGGRSQKSRWVYQAETRKGPTKNETIRLLRRVLSASNTPAPNEGGGISYLSEMWGKWKNTSTSCYREKFIE